MAAKFSNSDIDNMVDRYVAGLSIKKVSELFGICDATAAKILGGRGVIRKKKKITQSDKKTIIRVFREIGTISHTAKKLGYDHLTVKKILQTAGIDCSRRWQYQSLDHAKIISLFQSGIGAAGIADRFGVSANCVLTILKKNDIKPRDRSEQQQARMDRTSAKDRKKLVRAANIAAKGRKPTDESLIKSARTRFINGVVRTSALERKFEIMLKQMSIDYTPQYPVNRYNCDFVITNPPIAVEIFGGHWHFTGEHAARTDRRYRKILNSGFDILVIWCTKSAPLTRAAADYLGTLIEQIRSNPTERRRYWMIRGTGELVASGGLNDDQITLIPPTEFGFYGKSCNIRP